MHAVFATNGSACESNRHAKKTGTGAIRTQIPPFIATAKCNLYKGNFSYSGVVVWNSLPTSIKLASSLDIFVKKCTEWLKM